MSEVPHVTLIGSWWGVFFASLMAISGGASIAAYELIMQPVAAVDRLPLSAKDEPLTRYFVRGGTFGGDAVGQKLRLMADEGPRSVDFNEGDLNQFMSQAVKPADAAGDIKVSPNLHMSGSALQLGLIVQVSKLKQPIIFQASGPIKQSPGGFYLSAQRTYVGALPLPSFLTQAYLTLAFDKAFGQKGAENLVRAWRSLNEAKVEGGQLHLRWN